MKSQVCEASILSLGMYVRVVDGRKMINSACVCKVYSVGRPSNLQVIVLEETLSGINIVYVSEPHLHHTNDAVLHI